MTRYMEAPDVILARYEGKRCYADIECVGHGRELCVVCEVGLGEVVGLGNAAEVVGLGNAARFLLASRWLHG